MGLKIEIAPTRFFSTTQAQTQMASAKNIRIQHVETTMMASGETYSKHDVKDGRSALAAVLHMTLAHTADVFHAVLDAVSDHYKISKDEMMDVVLKHPAYTEVTLSPTLNDLGYFPPESKEVESKPKKKFVVKQPKSSV